LVLAADQFSKAWISHNLVLGESLPQDAPIRLTHIVNSGAAFGLLPRQNLVLVLVAVVVIGIVLFYQRYLPPRSLLVNLALGLQLGGATGNLTDRLRFGYVVDFIDIRVWPVFNLADFSIVLGLALLSYFLLFSSGREVERT
jgi:signal peptidase II